MQMAIARAALFVCTVLVGYDASAQTTTDSMHRDSAAQTTPSAGALTNAAGGIVAAAAQMPLEVRGYRLTDSLRLPGGNPITQYTYVHQAHDRITVLVSPYDPSTGLLTQQDTTAMLEKTVDLLRVSLDDAYHNGDLSVFRVRSERVDDLKAAGRRVRGYVLAAGLTHRGAIAAPAADQPPCRTRDNASESMSPEGTSRMCGGSSAERAFEEYLYYAVYALPDRVVRVRADLPLEVAANEKAPDFAHKLVAALSGSR